MGTEQEGHASEEGPADHWGGTSYTAGIRTHVLNILFGMKEVPETDSWKLIIDLLHTHHEFPALFKITINGKSWKYALPKGSGKSIDGDYSQIKPHTIEIPLNSGVIRKGSNSIALTSLEGSWILFDRSEERRVGKECRSRWSPYH